MLYDSETWKSDLKKELKEIKDFFENTDLNYDEEYEENENPEAEEREMLDVAFIKLQKFSIYSSIIIRKLIEANKISVELMGCNFAIERYAKRSMEEVTLWNGYDIEDLYNLENSHKASISIKDLTDSFIHSFHFMPKYNWRKIDEELPDDDSENWENIGILGVYFSSDKTKDKFLSFIEYKVYLNTINKVINDFISSIIYENSKIIKKSSKYNK